jgi:hypothetical protein
MTKRFTYNHNQLALPFGEVSARSLSLEDRQRAFWFLCFVCLSSIAVYIYAINATAHHLAVRQNLEKEVAQAAAEIGTLEFAHIELKNAVTIETAHEYGFTEVKQPLYVTRSSASALTLNTPVR